jgi:N,N-dimethylformamidase
MPLLGFISDERFVALPDVAVELVRDGQTVSVVRSSPRGAVYAEVPDGTYRVVLSKPGYGAKNVALTLPLGSPYQFRLLSDALSGYVWPKWSLAGERAEFRVHSPEPYRLSLWRCGLKREMVRLIGWFDEHGPRATVQITPDVDYTRSGVAWNRVGYGSPHHTQFAEAPRRSGLYYFHAETESGGHFAFPWVVAPSAPSSRIAVLAATNTWNAYNSFGGRSNYINAVGLPEEPTVNARQELTRYTQAGSFNEWMFEDDRYLPLSFERPEPGNQVRRGEEVTDPIRGRSECHLAPAEWRMLGWLEREGFGYDLYAEGHLDTGTLDLDAYRVLILGAHPEYWSRAMYRRVKEWVWERGGRLLYPGGNGLNCEVELSGSLFPSLEGGRGEGLAMRCLSHLPSGTGAMFVPDPRDPSRTLESRFHRTFESEAGLLGVVCTDAGIMTAAPYRVVDSKHWAFRGTGLRQGDLFGQASLHERCAGGASGHETDKMSASSPPGTVLLARGENPDQGGAEMVTYDTPSGGAVFSTGSITYGASLLVDENVSRITRNVLERFCPPS